MEGTGGNGIVKNVVKPVRQGLSLQAVPLIHFIASFFYTRGLFFKDFEYMELYGPIVTNPTISLSTEHLFCILLGKVFAATIIFSIWNILFFTVRNFTRKAWIKYAVPVFLVGLTIVFLHLPESFSYEIDNYLGYSYALRQLPFYWHHLFTSCFYTACMTFVPHPFSIGAVQWMFFLGILFHFYDFLQTSGRNNGRLAKFLFIVFLFPSVSSRIIPNPYRNCLYSMLAALFFILLYESIQAKKVSPARTALLILTGVFTALWRSEGIVLGILGFGMFCILSALSRAQKLKCAGTFLIAVLLLSFPQKAGDKKYLQSDYMLVNTVLPLQYIIRCHNNLTYKGAEQDLKTIDELFPLNAISQHGRNAYYSINYQKTKRIVQTDFTEEQRKQYMAAYSSLVLHNPKSFAKAQLSFFLEAMGTPRKFYFPAYEGPDCKLAGWKVEGWDKGLDEYMTPSVKRWKDNGMRNRLNRSIDAAWEKYTGFLMYLKLPQLTRILLIMAMLCIALYEARLLLARDAGFDSYFLCAAAIWLMELGMIVVFMPDGRTAYLYPFFLSSFFISITFLSQFDFEFKLCIKRHNAAGVGPIANADPASGENPVAGASSAANASPVANPVAGENPEGKA
ncbi:MAG: hypothetical protein K6G18_09045 [Treponema sp.]|nr:hypothetical protein [Treponema sp.]